MASRSRGTRTRSRRGAAGERREHTVGQVDHLRLVRLRVLGIEPDGAGEEFELGPAEVQDLALAHPRVERDEQDWPEPRLGRPVEALERLLVEDHPANVWHAEQLHVRERARQARGDAGEELAAQLGYVAEVLARESLLLALRRPDWSVFASRDELQCAWDG